MLEFQASNRIGLGRTRACVLPTPAGRTNTPRKRLSLESQTADAKSMLERVASSTPNPARSPSTSGGQGPGRERFSVMLKHIADAMSTTTNHKCSPHDTGTVEWQRTRHAWLDSTLPETHDYSLLPPRRGGPPRPLPPRRGVPPHPLPTRRSKPPPPCAAAQRRAPPPFCRRADSEAGPLWGCP